MAMANDAALTRQDAPARVACFVCGRPTARQDAVPLALVRAPIANLIRRRHSAWPADGYICADDLRLFRAESVREMLAAEKGELSELEKGVLASLEERSLITENVAAEYQETLGVGQRLADRIAAIGGSWAFILPFCATLVAWMTANTVVLTTAPFDPYPFILLNLVLSCVAALQAPVIMMSQNRQEAKDRVRAEHDYQINLKAELEIRHLHEKLDHLLLHQWQRLLEIQQVQTEMIEETARWAGQLPRARRRNRASAEAGEPGPRS
jgi:uncharacterized membrane protein